MSSGSNNTGEAMVVVPVPLACRPRRGVRPVPFDVACKRAQSAFDDFVSGSQGELIPIVAGLLAVEAGGRGYSGSCLRELMTRANDVRGVALTLGAGLVAEIAHTIFELAECALPDRSLPGDLVALLGQSCQRLVQDPHALDQADFDLEVRTLLLDVRRKMLGQCQV